MLRKIFLITILLLCGTALSFAKAKIAPYYQLQFDIGEAMPSKGEAITVANLTNDLGVIFEPADKHKIIGFYELKYTGPGLRKEEGDKFNDRTMDHVFVVKDHYAWTKEYTLKSQIDYMREYRRTAANELWGTGLYDFNRTGFILDVNRKYSEKLSGDLYMQYHYLEFPNYTDLLAEFQAGETSESSTGKQNHYEYQLGAKAKYGKLATYADLTMLQYTKQKVISDTVQPNKTYYSDTLQKDFIVTLDAEYEQRLWNTITLVPTFNLKNKTSNQNYQHFNTVTDTVPVRYLGDYYSYSLLDLSCPITFALSKTWAAFINPELNYKLYTDRPPRNSENQFLSGRQYDNLFILSVGFSKKQNDITTMTIFYTYQSQVSNMTFEKYLLYNYDAHFIGMSFTYTY